MKRLAMIVSLAASCAFAGTIDLQPLPAPTFADTEVSTNCQIAAWNADMRRFRFELDFNATPSNNIQVAFGTDTDGDGSLGVAETAMAIGWDCGKWFVGMPPEDPCETAPDRGDGQRVLLFDALLSPEGVVKSVAIMDGEDAMFTGLPDIGALYSPAWDTMRLTARGIDDPDETFQLRLLPDGLVILLR